MDKNFRYAIGLSVVALLFFAFVPKASATEAILNGIEVKPLNNSYEITLNTDQAVPLKTNSPDSDKMIIDLKNIMPSKSVNTVYNNASNIDHVLIQPVGDDLRITIQGLNVSTSNVLLNAPKVPSDLIAAPPATEITLNRAIDSYTPITPEEGDADLGDILSLTNIDLKNLMTPSGLGWLFGLGIIMFFLLRSMKETKEQAKKYEFSPRDILRQKSELKRASADVDVYAEISKAQSKFNESLKRKQSLPKQNVSLQSYGMKEYQNSQINPYNQISKNPAASTPIQQSATAPKPTMNKLQEAVQAINQRNAAMQAKEEEQQATTTPIAVKPAVTNKDIQRAEARLNNVRFLENMTQIYEKNGRVDLAQNIREKIRQKNI